MRRRRILVVEDESSAATTLVLHLRGQGYTTLGPASTAEEALSLALSENPDLILMDVGLSGPMDGVETAWAIRAQTGVGIIFMTALPAQIVSSRIWGLKALGLIEKPFDLDDITDLIDRLP